MSRDKKVAQHSNNNPPFASSSGRDGYEPRTLMVWSQSLFHQKLFLIRYKYSLSIHLYQQPVVQSIIDTYCSLIVNWTTAFVWKSMSETDPVALRGPSVIEGIYDPSAGGSRAVCMNRISSFSIILLDNLTLKMGFWSNYKCNFRSYILLSRICNRKEDALLLFILQLSGGGNNPLAPYSPLFSFPQYLPVMLRAFISSQRKACGWFGWRTSLLIAES